MTVFVLDPFVSEEEIHCFLRKHVMLYGEGKKELDWEGVWTGKRSYWMSLRPDSRSMDGLSHPPAVFDMGSEKGFLVYPGQPITCRRCFSQGHYARECCEIVICDRCKSKTHTAQGCVKCFTCGLYGHGYREC
ncbi:ZCHC3 protein, partial [Atractosteus spatula]|nr:ZCHC3 protein [Atractosteus spatula]